MGEKVTFNPYTRIIQVDEPPDVDGIVNFDVKADLYSDGKEDWRTDETLRKLLFPVRVVGGDPLPGSKALGATFFLASDWKIRPYEGDHRFAVNGNLYSEDGTSPFISTVGNYNVFLEQQVSSLVDSTVQQLDEIEYGAFNGGVTYDEDNGFAGTGYLSDGRIIGTPRAPSGDVYDARTIAGVRGFTDGYILSDMTIPQYELDGTTPFDLVGFKFWGSGKDRTKITIPDETNAQKCTYINALVTGFLDGDNTINSCLVENLDYIKGYVESCVLSATGEIKLGGSDTAFFLSCYSGEGIPTINCGGSGQPLVVEDHSGSLRLINKTGPETVEIGLKMGKIIVDLTTVTNGTIMVYGTAEVYDQLGNYLHSGAYGSLTIESGLTNKYEIVEEMMKYDGAY